MIFYLSSQGHAATKWISDAFSLHPNVVSFHGIRSMPPVTIFEEYDHFGVALHQLSGNSHEVADNLARGLYQCAKHSDRVFGAAHTIWGMHCRKPFEELGGKFGGIVRHPIMQFHSMMNAFTPRALSQEKLPIDFHTKFTYLDVIGTNPDLFLNMVNAKQESFKTASFDTKIKKIKWKLVNRADKKKVDNGSINVEAQTLEELRNNRSDTALINLLSARFHLNLNRVFDDHREFITLLPEEDVIVMEKITSDFEYFSQKFKRFTGFEYPEDKKDKIFKLDHGHRHTKKKTTPEEVWNSWSKQIQSCFVERLKKHEALLPFYEEQGYWLPAI